MTLKILRIILFLFIFSSLGLFFRLPVSLQAEDSTLKEAGPAIRTSANETQQQNNLSPAEPLDYILLQADKINDPYDRCELLIKIADAYVELGEPNKSENVLNRAADLARHKENELERAVLLSEIIEEFITLDKIDTAKSLLQYIGLADSRNDLMIKIISGYLRQNQCEKALGLVKEIYEPTFKAIALYKITETLSQQNLYDQLMKAHEALAQDSFTQSLGRIIVREEIEIKSENPAANVFIALSRSKKVKALVALAEKQIASGRPSEASEKIIREATLLAENIKSKYLKDECLAKIGIAYVKIGRYEIASTIANSIKIPFSRSELLADIAAAYLGSKEFKKAYQLLKDIDVGYFKEKVIAQIIIQYIEQGEEQEVSGVIAMLSSIAARSRAYAAVAEYFTKKENFYQTFNICQKIEDPKIRIITLLEITTELQKKGKNSQDLRQQLLNCLKLLNNNPSNLSQKYDRYTE